MKSTLIVILSITITACSIWSKTDSDIEVTNSSVSSSETITQSLIEKHEDHGFCVRDGEAYSLGADDEIEITVYGEQSLSGDFIIDSKGKITMPLIGRVGVAGCSTEQVRQIVTDRYKDGYLIDPNIAVTVLSYSPVFVIGEVRAPGKFDFENGITVLKAVALAGGFTYRANQRSIRILRNDEDGSTSKIDVSAQTEIKPGDIITVKERLF